MIESRHYHHGNLRQVILDTALSVINEQGESALSLRDIAREVGVSHSAPLRHFSTKADLITALAADGFERLAQQMTVNDIGQDKGVDCVEALIQSGIGYVVFGVRNPGLFRVMFGIQSHLKTESAELGAAAQKAKNVLVTLVMDGIKAGRLKSDDVDTLVLTCWAMVHGLATLAIDGQGAIDVEKIAATTRQVLLLLLKGTSSVPAPQTVQDGTG